MTRGVFPVSIVSVSGPRSRSPGAALAVVAARLCGLQSRGSIHLLRVLAQQRPALISILLAHAGWAQYRVTAATSAIHKDDVHEGRCAWSKHIGRLGTNVSSGRPIIDASNTCVEGIRHDQASPAALTHTHDSSVDAAG